MKPNAAFVMKILAIDFSSAVRSVALAETGAEGFHLLGAAEERHGQVTHAFAMIDRVLKEAGVLRDAVDRLALGLGPGSYAGIRVSLAIAQGWQLAKDLDTVGVSSMACLAATAQALGQRGPASFVVDAQRGEFYLADYELAEAGVQVLNPLAIVARTMVEARLTQSVSVSGPEVAGFFPNAKDLFPAAAALAKLAADRVAPVGVQQLEPIYLRAANFVKAPASSRTY